MVFLQTLIKSYQNSIFRIAAITVTNISIHYFATEWCSFNLLKPGVAFLYPLKTSEKHGPALQIRAGQRSITANLPPLTVHIYHVMIIVTGSFSRKSLFY